MSANLAAAVTKYLAQIGSKGGRAKTKAKKQAVRENGKRGGRPKGTKKRTA